MKWVGGKSQLLPKISELLPDDFTELEVYIEPFIGGGALLFHVLENYDFDSVYISDINPELIFVLHNSQDRSGRTDSKIRQIEKELYRFDSGRTQD